MKGKLPSLTSTGRDFGLASGAVLINISGGAFLLINLSSVSLDADNTESDKQDELLGSTRVAEEVEEEVGGREEGLGGEEEDVSEEEQEERGEK